MIFASDGPPAGSPGAVVGRLGGFLGPLEAILRRLGAILGHLEALLRRLEAVLDPQAAQEADYLQKIQKPLCFFVFFCPTSRSTSVLST